MTPMERLKPQFDQLKLFFKNSFKEINLNQSNYKESFSSFFGDREIHTNKGVKSDFIRIFKLQNNKEDTFTLAFSFDYLNKKEEEYKIKFSSSVGQGVNQNYSTAIEMNIEESRDKLNKVINLLKIEKDLNNEKILEIIQNEFLGFNFTSQNKVNKKRKIK